MRLHLSPSLLPWPGLSIPSRGTNHGKTAVNFAIPHFHHSRSQSYYYVRAPSLPSERVCYEWVGWFPSFASLVYLRRCDTFADSKKAKRPTNDAIRDTRCNRYPLAAPSTFLLRTLRFVNLGLMKPPECPWLHWIHAVKVFSSKLGCNLPRGIGVGPNKIAAKMRII